MCEVRLCCSVNPHFIPFLFFPQSREWTQHLHIELLPQTFFIFYFEANFTKLSNYPGWTQTSNPPASASWSARLGTGAPTPGYFTPLYGLLLFHCVYTRNLPAHSLTGHLGCLHASAIVNNVSISKCLFEYLFAVLWSIFVGVKS